MEVSILLELLSDGIANNLAKLHSEGVRIVIIGDLSVFSNDLAASLTDSVKMTSKNTRLNLVIAINYSGRWDIMQATNKLLQQGVQPISEHDISRNLQTAEFGDVDLFIRTSGEMRLSNFMLWQSGICRAILHRLLLARFY